MSNKTIRIDLSDARTIKTAIKEVKAFRKNIEKGSAKLVKELAKTAQSSASKEYSSAQYAGENDVHVELLQTEELKATVSAEGNAALFIEFGTGITKSDAPEARADLKSGSNVVGHGQYGHHLGRMKNGWRYSGSIGSNPPSDTSVITEGKHKGMVQTKGNDATPALYLAKKEAERKLPELIKEAFKQ